MQRQKSPIRRSHAWRLVALCAALGFGMLAAGQGVEPPPMERRPRSPVDRAIDQMFRAVPEMRDRWSEHAVYGINAMDGVFATQGWNSEPDQFALSIAKESAQLPPWDVQGRYDLVVGKLSDRYMLDAAQEDNLREMLMRESNEFIGRNMGRMLPVMTEMAQLRLSGEPFTPEIVQRWSQQMAPLFYDARDRLKEKSAEFLTTLDPDQQAIVEQDLGATLRRMDRMEQLGAEWNDGRWRPDDWGMGRDPIQRGEMRTASGATSGEAAAGGATPGASGGAGEPQQAKSSDASAAAANPAPPPALPQSPAQSSASGPSDPWADYVKQFITKYTLDDGQQERAWIVYKSAVERREQQVRRFEARAGRVSGSAAQAKLAESRAASEKTIFDEMKRRLERLPTTAQRRTADGASRP